MSMPVQPSAPADSRAPGAPFDGVAASYDDTFTDTELGRYLRDQVWHRLDGLGLAAGSRILELGCGTGEDAARLAGQGHHVVATDASPRMLDVTTAKAARLGLSERVRCLRWDVSEAAPSELEEGSFDLVVSNFGALNCAPDRSALWAAVARLLRPGGRLAVVFMGPFCALEVVGFTLRGEWRSAVRRFRDGRPATIGDDTVHVWFPSIGRARRELRADFEGFEAYGIGTTVPPSHWAAFVARHPGWFSLARRLDPLFSATLGPWIADHYWLSAKRRPVLNLETQR